MAFVVGLAPVARPGVDLLVDQNEAIARSQGASEEEVALARAVRGELYAAGVAGDEAAAEQVVRDYFGALYDRQDAAVQRQLGDRHAFVQARLTPSWPLSTSPWFLSLLRSDAGADWRRVTAPTLGVFGGKDVQVVAALEAPGDAGGARGGRQHRPQRGHAAGCQSPVPVRRRRAPLAEYATLEQAFTPDLLPLVVDWIVERTGVQP